MPHPYSQSHSHTHSLKLKGGAANPVSGMLNSLTNGSLGTTPTAAAKPAAATVATAKPTVATATAAKPAATAATAVKKGGKKYNGGKTGKKYKGGDASNWVGSNFGSSVARQWNNTFANGGPGNAGNLIPTVHGAKAVGPHNVPQGSNMAYIKKGGQRRRHSGSHTKSCGCGSKRGGNYGQVLSAAAVPFGLMGANYLLSRRRRGKSARARTVRRRSRRRYT